MCNGNERKTFKWWYAKNIQNYGQLLEKQTAILTAMIDDDIIVQKVVSLCKENNLITADCGPMGLFYLMPNQMVSSEGSLKKFWLASTMTQSWNTPNILGAYITMEDNKAVMLPEKEVRLFGKPKHGYLETFVSYPVSAIIPIGEGNYIAWDKARNNCILIGDRETNEAEIKVLMEKTS